MASGHIRKREYKSGVSWQIVIENGVDAKGNRKRIYKTVKGTKKEAQKAMTKMLNELDSGTYIETKNITLGEYLDEWMKTYVEPNLAKTTIEGYKANVYGHIIPSIGNLDIQKINPIEIQKFYNRLLNENNPRTEKPLSTRTIEHIHANLNSALRQAVKIGIISKNPMEAVTKPKVKEYKAEVYNEDEVKQLLKYIKGTDIEIPVILAVALGLRRGEVLGLKWSSINLDEKILKVESNLVYVNRAFIFKLPKSSAGERTLRIPDTLIELLKKHKTEQKIIKISLGCEYEDNDLVCCKMDGRPMIPGTLSHKFADFLQQYSLKQIRFHDLRHTNASLLLKYGVSSKVASTRLGHSTIAITMDLYSHVYGEMEIDVANKIENGIFNSNVI